MIDFHLLAYVGVLLLFLAGVTVFVLTVSVIACTVLLTGIAFGIIKRIVQAKPQRKLVELPLIPPPMEEALHQVATGKVAAVQGTQVKPARETSTRDGDSKKVLLAAGSSRDRK